jgi:hypothetical protein
VERAKQLTVELNKEFLALGARVPQYHTYPNIDIEQYLRMRRKDGAHSDPELRFYEKCDLIIHKPLPEYMSGDMSDPESLNYGVLMYWRNPYADNKRI